MALALQFQLLYDWKIEEKSQLYPAFKVELNQVPVYRLIHHDFERHYLSAGQLFQACGLTLTEGFFLFDLKRADFSVDFNEPHFPYCDIWVDLERGRRMARALGVQEELEGLLSTGLDDCFSIESEQQMIHNWTVSAIPHLQYSTRALLETSFDGVERTAQVRTQIDRGQQQSGMVMKDRAQTGLVRWQVSAYEEFLTEEAEDCSDAVWDTLQGLLFDLQTLSRDGLRRERVLSDNMMIGNMPLKRGYLNGNTTLQQIYMVVMIEKMMHELSRRESVSVVPSINTEPKLESQILFHDRLDLFEQELYRLKKKAKKKLEEVELDQRALQQQLDEFNSWKIKFEKNRKSERIWILMFMLTVLSAILVFLK